MSYAESIFKVKRGFVIIGLTGYFNSGFQYVHDLLINPSKIELPTYETLSDNKKTHLNNRLFTKLEKVWESTPWKEFIDIDFSKIIFSSLINAALKQTGTDDQILVKLQNSILPKFIDDAADIDLLWNKEFDQSNANYTKVISLYRKLEENFDEFKTIFLDKHDYITKMQQYGSSLRQFGEIPSEETLPASPEFLFVIPEAARRIIKAMRTINKNDHFVIKSFKNPYEVEFFKRRYSEFYLLGTLREFKNRDIRELSQEKLDVIEKNERNESIEVQNKENISQWISHVNVKECLQKTDYFINCNSKVDTDNQINSRFNLVKLISLIKSPGCISPNFDERGMQIAMTVRQVSRCISRQVGATVFDSNGYLIGVGWNDPPADQVPCSLRTAKELIDGPADGVFSEHECSDEFVKHIRETYPDPDVPFCFRQELPKSIGKPDKMSEYSRALHAEENAFFQALWNGGKKVTGGTLYVTDSTCNLCAKKAYQLEIARILYVDEYPGIAIAQTLKSGKMAIEVNFFEGGTGEAYFKLYTRLLQEKDLIQLYPST